MPYKDKAKQKAAQRAWYENTRLPQKRKMRARFEELTKDHKCVACGELEKACIDYHHVDPTSKENTISSILLRSWCYEELEAELAKCIPLCANCHRKHHAGLIEIPGG